METPVTILLRKGVANKGLPITSHTVIYTINLLTQVGFLPAPVRRRRCSAISKHDRIFSLYINGFFFFRVQEDVTIDSIFYVEYTIYDVTVYALPL